jgi:hypothetical protein
MGKWVYHSRPPVRVIPKDSWNIYIATEIMTCHIWTFQIYIVQPGHHGPLDCIYNLSSRWNGVHIWLLEGRKQRRLQTLWKRIEIVSDETYSFTVNICVLTVVKTSGFWYSAYKKYVQDPTTYDRRSEKKKIKYGPVLQVMFRLVSACFSLFSLTEHYWISRNQPAFPPAEPALWHKTETQASVPGK